MRTIIVIVILILIGLGTYLLWSTLFSQPSEENGSNPQPPPQSGEQTWERLEDFVDGYTIEYPAGPSWLPPIHSTHTLQIPNSTPHEPNYFILLVSVTPNQNEQLQRAVVMNTRPGSQVQQIAFGGQNATHITTPENAIYIFAHNSAVWTIRHPIQLDPKKAQIAERILNSFTLLTPQEITQSIQKRYGTQQQATERDNTRKQDLQAIQSTLRDYFRAHGRYPIVATEDKIYEGKQNLSSLHLALADESKAYILYATIPGDPREDFYYRYFSANGTTYVLSAQLEQEEETDCDRSLSQQICLYAVRP
jgi:type II secretory pathway pseudopilin PulG